MRRLTFRNTALLSAALPLALLSLCLTDRAQSQGTPAATPKPSPDVASAIFRQPSLSPDGATLAFTYDGDIWSVASTGGIARRLTSTLDDDANPIFSPDGKWLAFSSKKYGSSDVYVMPAVGGFSRRLTYHSATDKPTCWLPDSSAVIFESARINSALDLWCVRLAGGDAWPLTAGGYRQSEFHSNISPDGKHIVYAGNGGSSAYARRGYNGSDSNDVWLCDFDGVSTTNYRTLAASRANECFPFFMDAGRIGYVSYAGLGGTTERVSHLESVDLTGAATKGVNYNYLVDLREPSLAGNKLAYTTGSVGGWKLHVADLAAATDTVPAISIDADSRTAPLVNIALTSASQFAPSPDGKKLAVIAGYDVWVMPIDGSGPARQITDTISREKDVIWTKDSRKLVYASARTGDYQLYIFDVAAKEEKQLTTNSGGATHPVLLNSGKSVLACVAESRLAEINLDGTPGKIDIPGHFLGANSSDREVFDLSPDGKWITYTQNNALSDDAVVVAKLDTGEVKRISRLFRDCSTPRFSLDGKRITFANNEENEEFDIYVVELTAPSMEFDEDKTDKLFGKEEPKPETPAGETPTDKPADKPAAKPEPEKPTTPAAPKGESDPDQRPPRQPRNPNPDPAAPANPPAAQPSSDEPAVPAKPRGKPPETVIDFNDIDRRTYRVTTLQGNEFNAIGLEDGKTVLFTGLVTGVTQVMSLSFTDGRVTGAPKPLTTSTTPKGGLFASTSGREVWFTDAGVMQRMKLPPTAASPVAFKADQRRDAKALRAEAFRECVWTMKNYYYDPKMHGTDWDGAASTYAKAIEATPTGDEWGSLMNELLGELNSSHQGFTSVDTRSDGVREQGASLGLLFDAAERSKGNYKVTEVLARGACDAAKAAIKPGEYLVGLNGKAFKPGETVLDRELLWTAGKKTILHVGPNPTLDGSREIAVKPQADQIENELFYQRWVDAQRAMIHKLSGGRLGYVHIRAMDDASVRHFKHHLGDDMEGKEGVVLDVRFNGGGSTSVDLLEILIKRPWLYRTQRTGEKITENVNRSIAWEKPSCLLTNQQSFSNAEIMSEGFRTLEIGKIIGVETAGGCIGTGAAGLIDGSRIRLPGSGAYTVNGENLENAGRKPHITVENTPEVLNAGRDLQTETAVKVMLEQLGAKK
jgi:tricorn protease